MQAISYSSREMRDFFDVYPKKIAKAGKVKKVVKSKKKNAKKKGTKSERKMAKKSDKKVSTTSAKCASKKAKNHGRGSPTTS